ncbi:MAG: Rieske 2Fe-2S domain-containing protein [Candidatus Aminicenantes bacterium]|nr:Rieske 2Fe-2S domain-containing protein [Candidatus Aminicenantes bacterium]
MKRRNFLDIFFGGSLLATIAAFVYPVVRYVLPSKRTSVIENSIAAAKVGELPPNAAKVFKFGSAPAVLINTAEGTLVALSAICTHLTCTVRYDGETGTLFCPCHNGRFDLSGNVLSGPPPRPLETYAVEISGPDIIVSRKG